MALHQPQHVKAGHISDRDKHRFSYVNQIWYTDAVWRTSEAPEFKPGWIACTTFGGILILTTLVMRYLELKDKKRTPGHANTAVEGNPANAPAVLAAHDGDAV